jgi:GT2 family glycosyltransferase
MSNGLYSMYISGANAFMKKKYFLEIGGLNELFSPFYVEDFELSLRAWRLGYTCYYDHNAICRHRTSATIISGNKKKNVKKVYNRNKMYLHAIHLSNSKRVAWFLQLTIEAIVHLFTAKWSYIRALYLFLTSYGKVRKSRIKLKQTAGAKKLLAVDEVVAKIMLSIEGKEVIRL